MNINRLNLNLVKVFVAINECGNLTRAAQRLHLSQPGVSHALKQLRETFDDELFVRHAQEYKPTARAEALAPAFLNALETLQTAIEESWHFDPLTDSATFRISASDYSAQTILPSLIERLATAAPGVSCGVSQPPHTGAIAALNDRSLDLAIISRLPDSVGPGQQVLLREEPCCIARRGNPLTVTGFDLETFSRAEHVIVSNGGLLQSDADKRLAELGRERRVRFSVPYFSSVAKIVAATDLVSTLPRHIAEPAALEFPLDLFPFPFDFPHVEFVMAWHPLRESEPQLRWLRELIASVVK